MLSRPRKLRLSREPAEKNIRLSRRENYGLDTEKSITKVYRILKLFATACFAIPRRCCYGFFCVCVLNTYYTRLTVLETLQKRAIRIICNTSYRAHTKPLFKYLNILPFECINKLQLGIFMYKLHSNLILASFDHWFCKNSDVHDHFTRSTNKYDQQSVRTTSFQHCIRICGPLYWNSLPLELTGVPTIYQFKYRLKLFLLNALVKLYES